MSNLVNLNVIINPNDILIKYLNLHDINCNNNFKNNLLNEIYKETNSTNYIEIFWCNENIGAKWINIEISSDYKSLEIITPNWIPDIFLIQFYKALSSDFDDCELSCIYSCEFGHYRGAVLIKNGLFAHYEATAREARRGRNTAGALALEICRQAIESGSTDCGVTKLIEV